MDKAAKEENDRYMEKKAKKKGKLNQYGLISTRTGN